MLNGGCRKMTIDCQECGNPVPDHLRDCIVCGAAHSSPNVRAALRYEEQQALSKRREDALNTSCNRGCENVFEQFGEIVQTQSFAVIARSILQLSYIVSQPSRLYVGFQQELYTGSRIPEDNAWDKGRRAAEDTIHPNYSQNINYAALSLSPRGAVAYGSYGIILNDKAISLRSTVFEENPFHFCVKHNVFAGQPAPAGYRATWQSRGVLAQAKLHSSLQVGMNCDVFSDLILMQGANTGDVDCIEVHIYGPIHPRAIERVVGPQPSAEEMPIARSVEKKLNQFGAHLEFI